MSSAWKRAARAQGLIHWHISTGVEREQRSLIPGARGGVYLHAHRRGDIEVRPCSDCFKHDDRRRWQDWQPRSLSRQTGWHSMRHDYQMAHRTVRRQSYWSTHLERDPTKKRRNRFATWVLLGCGGSLLSHICACQPAEHRRRHRQHQHPISQPWYLL